MSLPEKAFAPRSFDPGAICPLDGIRVVDLSRLVAGNMVSLQLADHGAEVIKIEDPARAIRCAPGDVKGVSLHWKVYARNKKSAGAEPAPAGGPRRAARPGGATARC